MPNVYLLYFKDSHKFYFFVKTISFCITSHILRYLRFLCVTYAKFALLNFPYVTQENRKYLKKKNDIYAKLRIVAKNRTYVCLKNAQDIH